MAKHTSTPEGNLPAFQRQLREQEGKSTRALMTPARKALRGIIQAASGKKELPAFRSSTKHASQAQIAANEPKRAEWQRQTRLKKEYRQVRREIEPFITNEISKEFLHQLTGLVDILQENAIQLDLSADDFAEELITFLNNNELMESSIADELFAEVNQRIKQLTEEELEALFKTTRITSETGHISAELMVKLASIILLLLLLSNLLVACAPAPKDSPPTVVATAQVETPPTSSATYPAGEGTGQEQVGGFIGIPRFRLENPTADQAGRERAEESVRSDLELMAEQGIIYRSEEGTDPSVVVKQYVLASGKIINLIRLEPGTTVRLGGTTYDADYWIMVSNIPGFEGQALFMTAGDADDVAIENSLGRAVRIKDGRIVEVVDETGNWRPLNIDEELAIAPTVTPVATPSATPASTSPATAESTTTESKVEVNIPQSIIDYATDRGLEVQALSKDEFRLFYQDETGNLIQVADYRAYDNAADKLTISLDTGEGEIKQDLLVDYKFDWYTNGDETYLRGYGRDAHRYRFDKDRGVWIYGAETVEMPTEYGVITINNETEIPFDEIDPEAANIAHRAALFALGIGEPEWPEMRQIVDTFIRNNGITRGTQEKVAGADELVEQVVQMVLERIAENNNLYHIKFPNEYKYSVSAQGKQDRQIMGFGDYVLDPTSVVITLLDTHTAVATNKIKGTYQWVFLVSDVDAGVAVNFDNGKLNIVIITDVHNDNRYNSALAAALNLLSWRAGVFGAFPEDVLTTETYLLNDDMWMSATGNQGFSSRPNVSTVFGFDIALLNPQD